MKKIILATLLFAGLFFGANTVLAAPHHGPQGPHGPKGHHGAPPHHGHIQRPPHHGHMQRPPHHNHAYRPAPRIHNVRYYSGYYDPCYCGAYYPYGGIGFGFSSGRYHHPIHHHCGLGASFHISI
ncbi:hypothetical protein IJX73_01600 [bacterium]|nr:hypothetical protein [bacterium]MBQ9149604.1 hypothetical protein [bacterium]